MARVHLLRDCGPESHGAPQGPEAPGRHPPDVLRTHRQHGGPPPGERGRLPVAALRPRQKAAHRRRRPRGEAPEARRRRRVGRGRGQRGRAAGGRAAGAAPAERPVEAVGPGDLRRGPPDEEHLHAAREEPAPAPGGLPAAAHRHPGPERAPGPLGAHGLRAARPPGQPRDLRQDLQRPDRPRQRARRQGLGGGAQEAPRGPDARPHRPAHPPPHEGGRGADWRRGRRRGGRR
mmetsp:Transcript_86459/g.186952  ORF Transcript_86459/g.186952 Transcript_86459/m.186952 type:complete len:233 (-) Transcript_86459:2603-3301(-)